MGIKSDLKQISGGDPTGKEVERTKGRRGVKGSDGEEKGSNGSEGGVKE